MLSRETLGEMLAAANEQGVLNGRGGAGKLRDGNDLKRARRRRAGASTATVLLAQESDGGALEKGNHPRISSPSPSAHARFRYPLVDARKSTKRGFKSSAEGGMDQRRVLLEPGRRQQLIPVYKDPCIYQAPPTSGSPTKRRRFKLYDHDHNPRVLRTLVDDSIITGIAGAGVLRAEEGKQMDELRLQLRLACHRATELEEQIFQSQTGAPHRELLGELQLGKTGSSAVPLLEGRTNGTDRKVGLNSSAGGEAEAPMMKKTDLFKRCRTPDITGGRRPVKQQHRSPPTKFRRRRQPLDVSFPAHESASTKCLKGSSSSSSAVEKNEKMPRWDGPNISEVVTTCYPPRSPLFTPTASLRRYLSSLRPFSADSARAAWGLADSASGGSFTGPGTALNVDPFDSGQPRWPVLFVMGSSKPPPTRHPLGVHALPLFDGDLVALLAEATGEPAETIRAMAKVLSSFDFRLLQFAVTRLCRAHAGEGARSSVMARKSRSHRPQRDGAPGPATQAWRRKVTGEGLLPGPAAAVTAGIAVESLQKVERQALATEEPLIVSEAVAGRALTGGFLCGVFGEGAVRDIIAASRPVVVFDSTEAAVAAGTPQLPPRDGIVSVEMPEDDRGRPGDGADRDFSHGTEHDEGRGSSSQAGEGNAHASAACQEELSQLPPTVDPRQVTMPSDARSYPSDDCHAPGDAPLCLVGGSPHAGSPRQAENTAPGKIQGLALENCSAREGEGVLVGQLVRATAARFRVHSLAVRHRVGGVPDGGGFGQGLFIGGSGGSDWTEEGRGMAQRMGRPASAGSDELGLPPLKLVRKDKRNAPRRHADRRQEEEDIDVDAFGVPRPRSTPRCLRSGYEGEITAAMLRQELEASESTAARLGISMARKAEAWKVETQEGGGAAAATAAAAANRAALALASTRAREALLEAANERVREAVNIMYLGIVRRSWNAWTELAHRQRSLKAAERFARLVGAAALGFGVVEPLLRRRLRTWLRRWAGAMRAERVLEVQAAAVELQRTARGFLGRRRARKRQRHLAALAVQRVARGRAGRARGARRARMMAERRALRTIEQKYHEFVWQRGAAKQRDLKKKDRAATKVQAAWRGAVYGRRPARRLRELRGEEASTAMLQRLWRGVVARGRFDVLMEAKRRREAAVRIQAAARGRGARNVYGPIILRERAAATISRFWRCARAKAVARRKRWSNALAARLNPLVRGFLGRRVAKAMLEARSRKERAMILACVVAQKLLRGKQGRLKARRELLRRCAAVELQRLVRGHAVRKLAHIQDERDKSLAAAWMAALTVQRLWRGGLKGKRNLGQRAAEKRLWNAAFTIQTTFRRQRLRRRRLERASKQARGALNAAAAWQQGLEHGEKTTKAAAAATKAAREKRGKHGGDNAAAASGPSTAANTSRGDSSAAVVAQAGENAEMTGGGTAAVAGTGGEATAPDSTTTGEGDEAGGRSPSGTVPNAAAVTQPEYQDLGDVALAAVLLANAPVPTPPPPAPVDVVVEEPAPPALVPLAEEKPGGTSPPPLETLEYYEAKMRYLAAQEKAHGRSA
ncbi:unnamed protein product [Pylaiella littoralis]